MGRRRFFEVLEPAKPGDSLSWAVDGFLMGLILLNVLGVILQSVEAIYVLAPGAFESFEVFSIFVFTLEYLGRLWSCIENPRFARPIFGRVRYAFTPLALIDLLAILPFYLNMAGMDMRFLRAFRLFRILRVMRLGRYAYVMALFQRVYLKTREELVVTAAIMAVLLTVAAGGMYYAEREAQPDVFSSIPAAMWWTVVTLTTVGYGDTYPITALGRLLGAWVAILGVGVFALPTGILGSAFVEEIKAYRKKAFGKAHCPTCGRPFIASQRKLRKNSRPAHLGNRSRSCS
jgi:voltage-gated potassium channel